MRPTASIAAAAALALVRVAEALDPAPVALQAGSWLGNDGNWSSVSFLLGSSSAQSNVFVSTSLSEFWAIGPGGCVAKEPRCIAARGGIYSPSESKQRTSIGFWQLGLQYLGLKANGEYGLDTISTQSPITNIAFGMSNVIIAAVNTTQAFIGYLGLGIQQGRFGDKVIESPLTQAVQTFGLIPSYSYGFTAGAHYRKTVVSATLGGYDAARFEPHDTTFSLMPNNSNPQALVRSIWLNSLDKSDLSVNYTDVILSSWEDNFTAVIDSSTPYLWLPEQVCKRWAAAYDVSYNDTFDLYTMAPEKYLHHTADETSEITFSLSSFDNKDNFGRPLQIPGVVNITLPTEAFVSLLQFPFGGGVLKYGDSAVPYLTVRISKDDNFILGRSFLQESYLITKFDESLFSIHQAKFPANPEADARLVAIDRPRDSPYPAPPQQGTGLSLGQMIGIAVGAFIFCVLLLLSLSYFFRRRKRSRRLGTRPMGSNKNDSSSTLASDGAKKPVLRIFSKISRRKRPRSGHVFPDEKNQEDHLPSPSEAPDCQIFELAAPVPPVELDAGNHDDAGLDDSELSTDMPAGVSAYELARRKLDHQLRGPVPAYTPPQDEVAIALAEKLNAPESPSDAKLNIVSSVQPSQQSLTTIAKSEDDESNVKCAQSNEPSPVSPREDWHSIFPDPPSPVTVSAPSASSSGTRSRGGQTGVFPAASNSPQTSDSADAVSNLQVPFQRRPIDESRFVCLGPLPDHVKISPESLLSQIVGGGGQSAATPPTHAASLASEASLGSNYTEEESDILGDLNHREASSQAVSHHVDEEPDVVHPQTQAADSADSSTQGQATDASSPTELCHIDPGVDLVHVPQMAAKRYSWEDE
ncbi:hypothetical protein CDD81_4202 [Ophiocordyceps australis]|uniref:Peptidase A1 domain-containing protein n=1 Tax=Ophiocordyceps australis TaxID=1399860 RepID=A0A2C5YCI9_9HYPO|nr:hypothetical protein CDD81_4202 [Ophiocordyceps australis]